MKETYEKPSLKRTTFDTSISCVLMSCPVPCPVPPGAPTPTPPPQQF